MKVFLFYTWVICGLFVFGGCGGSPSDPDEAKRWAPIESLNQSVWWMNAFGLHDVLFVVGGTPEEGKLMQKSGDEWREVTLPESVPLLNWGHALGDGSVFVVGNSGSVALFDQEWMLLQTPTDQNLWGVWGAAKNDVWAVGGSGRVGGEAVILHWDGRSWSKIDFPALERANVFAFFKVWGFDRDDVYVVGQRGAVLHFDGDQWQEIFVDTGEDLISLWGAVSMDNSEKIMVMVGGRSNGVVVVGRNGEFQTRSVAPLPGLNGVWMNARREVWVAGLFGTLARINLETFEFVREEVSSFRTLHSVFGIGMDYKITVGGNLENVEGPFEGIGMENIP